MKRIQICSALILYALSALAQGRPNYGLLRPQPDSTLPRGRTAFDVPVRKAKKPSTTIQLKGSQEFRLTEGWELAEGAEVVRSGVSPLVAGNNTTGWYDATVPGTVLTTLVEQGVYPDPYLGLNNMSIPDTLCRQDWWYRLSFATPEQPKDRRAWLHFDGINYKAAFYLNGQLLGQTTGAFKRSRFDVTGLLRSGAANVLAVHILPPPNPGIPHEQSFLSGMGPNGGQLAMDGPTFISSEGWDWVPGIRDRNIGIWQDVRLSYTGPVVIGDPQVITDLPLPDTTRADLRFHVPVRNTSNTIRQVRVLARFDGKTVEKRLSIPAATEVVVSFLPADHPALRLRSPKLWWPNGYGRQTLHPLAIEVLDEDRISDQKSLRFGIREFSYELMVDAPQRKAWRVAYSPTNTGGQPVFDNLKRREVEPRIFIPSLRPGVDSSVFTSLEGNNPFLVIRCNGQRIFCRGGNWGMDEGMKRVDRERLEPAFRLHQEANYNMIRNWTGESTEEVFFELADEYGMLVWNDFWISTEGYNLNPLNQDLFLENSLDAIRRYRNHPSIAVWCPRNEGYAPGGIEEELYTQLMKEDGTRHYIGNSRELNLRPSGDWHYVEDPTLYFTKYADGFSTEIGTFSVPVATTLRKFLPGADLWPIGDAWHYHDLHSNNQNLPGYLRAVDSLYGKPADVDAFSRKVQLVNYESHRAMFEGFNSKMWDRTSGVLLWMTHPAWPSMIWQTYSWDHETHGSYFGSKKACEPVHVQMNRSDKQIVVLNTTLAGYQDARLEIDVYDLGGKRIGSMKKKLQVSANARTTAADGPPAVSGSDPYLVRLLLKDRRGQLLSQNDYWIAGSEGHFNRFNALPDAAIAVRTLGRKNDRLQIEVSNSSDQPLIGLKFNLADEKDEILLPAYFSQGYINLLPGEKTVVEVQAPKGLYSKLRTEAYNSAVKFFYLNSQK